MKHVHFIGIGGISMSAIAEIVLSKGNRVTGSDRQTSKEVEKLIANGAEIEIGQSAENIDKYNVDQNTIVVYTAAISEDDSELVRAREVGAKVFTRSKFLGELLKEYDKVIAVSGTHGKTTTTSMIANIFLTANRNPSILVGSQMPQIDGNVRIGGSEYMILEACEYVDSFLDFYPETSVITNIDADHLNYFKNLDNIKKSFVKFTENTSKNVVINANDENTLDILPKINKNIIKTSVKDFDRNINLPVYGEHNMANAMQAIAVARLYGIEEEYIKEGLETFVTPARRFEYIGDYKNIKLYDDYAHHPTEIKTTLDAAKQLDGNTYVIFQSHTYTRTQTLYKEFVDVISKFDNLIVADIYAARENPIEGIDAQHLAKDSGGMYLGDFDDIERYIIENTNKIDNLVSIGAGDANQILYRLLTK